MLKIKKICALLFAFVLCFAASSVKTLANDSGLSERAEAVVSEYLSVLESAFMNDDRISASESLSDYMKTLSATRVNAIHSMEQRIGAVFDRVSLFQL